MVMLLAAGGGVMTPQDSTLLDPVFCQVFGSPLKPDGA
jgi:hypothetical protein